MTRTTRFDPRPSLIYVTGTIAGPRGEAKLRLVLDTGAALTTVVPRVMQEVGYQTQAHGVVTSVSSALGKEHGYALGAVRFAALGFSVTNFPVNVFDLGDGDACDGLIGNNFLRLFNYQVRSKDGCIVLENLAPLAA
jgi:predicted aspartyl protease